MKSMGVWLVIVVILVILILVVDPGFFTHATHLHKP